MKGYDAREKKTSKVLIIDFGSQFTQLIARRVRENKVYCEVIAFKNALTYFREQKPQAIILSGSPASSLDIGSPQIPQEILESNIPLLGICYGQQIICNSLGGKTKNSQNREFGRAFIEIQKDCSLLRGMWKKGSKQQVWMSHGDQVERMPKGFEVIASSDSTPFAFIADEKRKYYAVQFHPEVIHTENGSQLIANFVHHVADIKNDWIMSSYRKDMVSRIKKQVGDGRVICAVSGGVDSTVAACLIYEAIGENLTCVLVDHGFMRKNEVDHISGLFKAYPNLSLRIIDSSEMFIKKLKNIIDPEVKRKIIGKLFIEVFEEEAKKIGGVQFLGQGTLYPDVIESISFFGGPSSVIKSHHNVGGLPERMNMQLVEPLKELFKDEVRLLGKELGLPDIFIGRHPCPGPGLAIRCIGEVTKEKIKILRESDDIYLEEIRKAGIYHNIWQAFTVLLPVQTVGVMGDERTYEYVCSLRAVTSIDGMTADFYHHDMKFLSQVSTRIVNEVKGINRVVYDITSKPPATIEWE
ncbi:glutamine-hydrolyzing GMP synthase [Candidatus Liberibacter africanus]|uniref:GMP synthase [glutamine-hydrolyzing] n=1 Tax=Candidatus Liberibacter africanus PTSAPSY TaxID=1277257 RepID=A0A0G3I6T4_LIBAF|nr:glutamine-hydrolyzing GMP synthase [Candidatus Liberibacter africanus]AKK20243.1 GMP synthase [Candidatus Liberibacter africanus PTSAPSY]QTP64015.1 glutamine-hydrolyzing GMP synthase [Candidatus Liberibacter africanus]